MRISAAQTAALAADVWFAGLSQARQTLLLQSAAVVKVADGFRVYGAGDRPNGLWAVAQGQVRLIGYPISGMEVLVRILSPGAWFGELSTLDGGPRPQDAVAYGPATLLHLSTPVVAGLCAAHPDLYRDLSLLVCAHERAVLAFIGQRVSQPTAARLARALHTLFEEGGRDPTIQVRQSELAIRVGVGRQTLNRELKRLERAGVVVADYASISVLDPDRLRRLGGVNLDGLEG